MKAIYLFLTEDLTLSPQLYNAAFDFYERFRTKRGKFFCWHNWEMFDVIPSGMLRTEPVCSICTKCGKMARKRFVCINSKYIDYSRFIFYQ